MSAPWSKLQSRLYDLFVPTINLQIHCTVYTEHTTHDVLHSPRHWITLDGDIIWDFPGPFLKWVNPDVPKPLTYMEEGHGWVPREERISYLFQEYIYTPKDEILDKVFEHDHWQVTNIFKAADRRIGKRRLGTLIRQLTLDEPAWRVIYARGKGQK